MNARQALKDGLREEWQVTARAMRSKQREMYDRSRGAASQSLIFRDMPRPEQMLPPVLEEYFENGLTRNVNEEYPSIEIPKEFFPFNSPETTYIINLILDANNARLRRMLSKLDCRSKLKEDRYYQLVDDPTLYIRDANSTESPIFHSKSMLYLTSIGIMIFLKRTEALLAASMVSGKGVIERTAEEIAEREARQPKTKQAQSDFEAVKNYEKERAKDFKPMFNVYAYQYATHVHCRDGDILRFQLDFMATKQHYYDAFPFLMQMDWKPRSVSMILYRRRYYQFMTPFLDWVDMVSYLLKTSPTISVATIYDRMINCHSDNLTMRDMLYQGTKMLECFELRKVTEVIEPDGKRRPRRGMYIGRKVLRDNDMETPSQYKHHFSNPAVRPVIPHVCSPIRRFLVHLYYYDNDKMSTLAQILALTESMNKLDFFSMHPLCKLSTIHLQPLVFQIYDFVWMIKKEDIEGNTTDASVKSEEPAKTVYLRQKTWEEIQKDEESLAWYLRWDVLNCISLLFGICQNALIKDLSEAMVDRIVRLIIEVLRSSEYLESVMSFSYFDTYFGLTTTVNCVPNLEARCVLRVLKRLPLYLVENFPQTTLHSMFTDRFWKDLYRTQKENEVTMEKMSEFLILRNRKLSMQSAKRIANEATGEENSRTTTGVLFCRDYSLMEWISPEREQEMDDDKNEGVRKEEETNKHIAEYKREETDYRYSQVFTDSYFLATGRPRVFYSETAPYRLCREASKLVFDPPSDA